MQVRVAFLHITMSNTAIFTHQDLTEDVIFVVQLIFAILPKNRKINSCEFCLYSWLRSTTLEAHHYLKRFKWLLYWLSAQEYHGTLIHTASTDKIFEKNSSFHVTWHTTGKVQFLFFEDSFGSIDKISFLAGRLGTRLYFHEVLTLFWNFLIS